MCDYGYQLIIDGVFLEYFTFSALFPLLFSNTVTHRFCVLRPQVSLERACGLLVEGLKAVRPAALQWHDCIRPVMLLSDQIPRNAGRISQKCRPDSSKRNREQETIKIKFIFHLCHSEYSLRHTALVPLHNCSNGMCAVKQLLENVDHVGKKKPAPTALMP